MGNIASRQVSWWQVHLFVEHHAARLGVTDWPVAGTPEWDALDDNDPRKMLSAVDAGQHHILRVETAQTAMCEASRAVSAAANWPEIGRRLTQRDEFYRQKPWLRRRSSV